MMLSREKPQQPFFKPITNTDCVNNRNNLFEPSSHMRQKTFQNVSTFQVSNAKENEAVKQDTNTLHALHQEADKIMKWKVQTEIEIKQKEKNIHEATCTIDMLRKSSLDLQLQNENLSLKLQEEIENREELLQRITSTRDICNLLKDHSVKTEDRLLTCETEKTELKYKEKENLKQFEELSKSFRELQLNAEEDHNKLTNQLTVEREHKQAQETEWKEKITTAECQLKELLSSCDDKDIEIRDIRSQLCKSEDKLYDMKTVCDDLEQKLRTSEVSVSEHRNKLEEATSELTKTKEHCSQLGNRIAELNETCRIHLPEELQEEHNMDCLDIDLLASYIRKTLEMLSQKIDRIQIFKEDLARMESSVEELKSSKDMLIMEKSEFEVKIAALDDEKMNLMAKIETEENKTKELEVTVSRLTMDLVGSKDKVMTQEMTINKLNCEINNLTTEKNATEESLMSAQLELKNCMKRFEESQKLLQAKCEAKQSLSKDLQALTDLLAEERTNHEETSTKLSRMQDQMVDTKKELALIKADAQSLQSEIQQLNKNEEKLQDSLESANHTKDRLEEKIADLTEEMENKIKENDRLRGERDEQDKSMHGEMESREKEASAFGEKIKTLKETVSSKTKQIKEVEKEMKNLKSKLTSQSKLTDNKEKEILKLKSALEEADKEKSEFQQQIDCLKLEACTEKQNVAAAKTQAKDMEMFSENMQKEKEKIVKKCEAEITNMTSTLEKYQQENHKLVAQKDKEIKTLKAKVQSVEQDGNNSRAEVEQKLQELQDEIEQQKQLVDISEEEKKSLEERCKDYFEKLTDLEETILTKDEKISELADVITSQKKNLTTSATQTDAVEEKTTPNPKSKKEQTPQVPQTPQHCRHEIVNSNRSSTPQQAYTATTPKTTTPRLMETAYTPVSVHRTPKLTSRTPQGTSNMKTPQRSILKHDSIDSAFKKRRVVFASPKENSDSSDTDSSQLMEIEIDELENRLKGKKGSTPLLVKPSPKVRSMDIDDFERERPGHNEGTIPLNRVPRGGTVKTNKKENEKTNSRLQDAEMKKFKDLFPNEHPASKLARVDLEEKTQSQKSCNVRKTPNKPPGKFFKNSPKDRPIKNKKTKGKEETSWFDLDSVFGFGPED
ncbi:synaptonemal complex protein 1-like [Ylistrum balloti]|uniref:synaptonemal complex protein 1-like n=1 Tax=Ylistrum balloti TaxID=509963 RepID=UPI002905E70A|nr:synaptonemal complex protein 1-like [Ylistrum balloti]